MIAMNGSSLEDYDVGNSNYIMEKFISEYNVKIYSFVYNIVKDREEAKDITQDIFVKAIKYIHSYNTEKNFVTWMFTIARNTTYDYLKKQSRNHITNTKELNESMNASHGDNPDVLYQTREEALQISKLIDKLPIKYKSLIHMKYMLGLSYGEIGEKLNIPISKVESRLYMARKKLQRDIEKLSGEEV